MRRALAGVLLWFAACSSPPPSKTGETAFPALPAIDFQVFQETIRERVEKAWQAVESSPESPQANGELATVLHAHQQYASAEICYKRARILEENRFEWVYLLAMVQSEQGKDDAAMRNLEQALELDPSYVPARVQLADLLMRNGEFGQAASLYREAIERDPQSGVAHYGLGRALSAQGRNEDAAEAFEEAIALYPNYGQAHYALAIALRKMGSTDESRVHFELGEKHKLEMPPSGDRLLTAVRSRTRSPTEYLRAGVELEKQGRLKESLAVHLESLQIDPRQAQAHINLISLYSRLGRNEKAKEHYRKAVAIDENLPDCHYNYGVIMVSEQRYEEAKIAFKRAVEINPFYAKAHHNLGVMLETEGKLEEAAREYRLAIENQPDYRLARFHLGRILVNQGQPRKAIEQFSRIIAPEDRDASGYLYALGIAHARVGERSSAITYMRKARDLASSFDQWDLLNKINRDLAALGGQAAER